METQIIAKAKSTNMPVSWKQVVEICNFIRGKTLNEVRKFLQDVLAFRRAVPYRRFKMNIPHQKSHAGPGRYPVKAAGYVSMVLESAVKNAENKGMKESVLYVKTAIANRGATVWHYGRQRRRQTKRTHLEIELAEKPDSEKKESAKAKHKKEDKAQKTEAKGEKQ